jgi:glycosyltransferase involved in cell wall biosynthesis
MRESLDNLSVTTVIYSFETGGSERLGADIARHIGTSGARSYACAAYGSPGPVSDWLTETGIETLSLDSPGRNRLGRMWTLYRHLVRTRCDVLHVHHFNMLVSALIPARLARVRRIVVTEHTDEEFRNSSRARRIARLYGRGVDAVSTVHAGIREYVVSRIGFPAHRVVVIPNGVDTNRFQPPSRPVDEAARSRAVDGKQVVVGCVGRLHPDKDHMNLLEAVRELIQQGTTGFEVRLVGDGSERPVLERFVEENDLAGHVSLLGERTDVADLYHTFDIFVLPSKTEGLPIALLEAMSSGLACLATSVGGVPEALEDGSGVVVRPGDWKALAEALGALIEDAPGRVSMGAAARRRALTEFDADLMFSRYEALLLGAEQG